MSEWSILHLERGFWYLASPYSKYHAGIEAAFKHASAAAGKLLANGVPIYSPIAHAHPIAEYGGLDHYSHDLFMPLDHRMMECAHGCLVLMMPGWFQSRGVQEEIKFFEFCESPWCILRGPCWMRPMLDAAQVRARMAEIAG